VGTAAATVPNPATVSLLLLAPLDLSYSKQLSLPSTVLAWPGLLWLPSGALATEERPAHASPGHLRNASHVAQRLLEDDVRFIESSNVELDVERDEAAVELLLPYVVVAYLISRPLSQTTRCWGRHGVLVLKPYIATIYLGFVDVGICSCVGDATSVVSIREPDKPRLAPAGPPGVAHLPVPIGRGVHSHSLGVGIIE
jgi:hypothetical protein